VNESKTGVATLAGGCFWCLEAVFQPLKGVSRVVSGYVGGSVRHPSYEQVCAGTTGHAEAIEVHFDPEVITYRTLVELFFAFHDPTTLNRQGPDIGTQYRSAVFFHDEDQRVVADEVIAELMASHAFDRPIVTEVVPATTFFPAEAYHQDYYRQNPNQPYCAAMIGPKVAKLRERYRAMLDREL
jgi:peptide-methionine (S)-S-oxide reductase